MASWTPRPVSAPTREAHLATLRAWHDSRFGAGSDGVPPLESGPAAVAREGDTGALLTPWIPPRAPIIVAAADSLVAVDPATGEVRA